MMRVFKKLFDCQSELLICKKRHLQTPKNKLKDKKMKAKKNLENMAIYTNI